MKKKNIAVIGAGYWGRSLVIRLSILKAILPEWLKEPIKNFLNDRRDRKNCIKFQRKSFLPLPHIVKVNRILKAATKHQVKVLVETGTFEGETVRKCSKHFERIYSIELSPLFAARAIKRFRKGKHIKIFQGNSADVLLYCWNKSKKSAFSGWTHIIQEDGRLGERLRRRLARSCW